MSDPVTLTGYLTSVQTNTPASVSPNIRGPATFTLTLTVDVDIVSLSDPEVMYNLRQRLAAGNRVDIII